MKRSTGSYILAVIPFIPICIQIKDGYFGLGREGAIAKYYRLESPEVFWGTIVLYLLVTAFFLFEAISARKDGE